MAVTKKSLVSKSAPATKSKTTKSSVAAAVTPDNLAAGSRSIVAGRSMTAGRSIVAGRRIIAGRSMVAGKKLL